MANVDYNAIAGNAVSSIEKVKAHAPKEEKTTAGYKERKTKIKNSDCYLRLDLKPNGIDLKEYINKNKGELSATAFIQNLIKADMERKKPKQTRTRLDLALDTLTEEQLKALLAVANEFSVKA